MKPTILKNLVTVFSLLFCLLLSFPVFAGEKDELRIAVLPILDVAPIYVAEANGYFASQQVSVEALPVGSPVERDQLMQAESVDGVINEVGGAALFNRDSQKMKIVSYARIPMGETPLFRLLASSKSGFTKIEELKGVPVAVSRNTVIEYITSRMFEAADVGKDDIAFASVPVLPERMQLLLSGQIKAATLPDPLALAAMGAGATEITNDLELSHLSASVISFSEKSVADKPASIKKFMTAWDMAVADLNSEPEKYRELILKKIRVPKNVQKTFVIPQYPRGEVPSQEQWDDVNSWLVDRQLLKEPVSFQQSVTTTFLAE